MSKDDNDSAKLTEQKQERHGHREAPRPVEATRRDIAADRRSAATRGDRRVDQGLA
jgi:hypothetical protein